MRHGASRANFTYKLNGSRMISLVEIYIWSKNSYLIRLWKPSRLHVFNLFAPTQHCFELIILVDMTDSHRWISVVLTVEILYVLWYFDPNVRVYDPVCPMKRWVHLLTLFDVRCAVSVGFCLHTRTWTWDSMVRFMVFGSSRASSGLNLFDQDTLILPHKDQLLHTGSLFMWPLDRCPLLALHIYNINANWPHYHNHDRTNERTNAHSELCT